MRVAVRRSYLRLLESHRNYNNSNGNSIIMKFRSTGFSSVSLSVAFLAGSSHAWIASQSLSHYSHRHCRFSSSSPAPLHGASPVTATAAATEEEEAAKSTTIADGTVVSCLPGGLVAVKINEDDYVRKQQSSSSGNTIDIHGDGLRMDEGELSSSSSGAADAGSATPAGGGDLQGKSVVLPGGATGVVVAHRPPLLFCYAPDQPDSSSAGNQQIVQVLDKMATVSVPDDDDNDNDQQPIIDCFGVSANEKTKGTTRTMERAIFAPIPQVKDISLINDPMLSGMTMVDTIAPIGRGQNMLLIGHNLTDLRGLSLNFMTSQLQPSTTTSGKQAKTTKCVYAVTDNAHEEAVLQSLKQAGIDQSVHVVAPRSRNDDKDAAKKERDSPSRAAEAVAIAGAACAVGEAYALEQGQDALVVIDTVDLHKTLWDATTRVLVDVFGVDAVVASDRGGAASSEMRAFYSSLIQRAGQYKKNRGGGSVTLLLLTQIPRSSDDEDRVFEASDFEQGSAKMKERIKLLVDRKIPLTAANLQKIDIPVPSAAEGQRRLVLQHVDDLISMSDGQVWFDEKLEKAGQRPPLDPQRSITRVGIGADTVSRADAPALRKIAEGLRLDLSQAASMEGAETNTVASRKQVRRQSALLLAMHQETGWREVRRLSESCVALLAASEGELDDSIDQGALAGTEEGKRVMEGLLDHARSEAASTMAEIDQTLDVTAESKRRLMEVIASYFSAVSSIS